MSVDLSVVIVSFNTKELTRDCLNSLADSGVSIVQTSDVCGGVVFGNNRAGYTGGGYKMEVWVVDNASSDGSAALVEKEFLWVNLIRLKENLGFSKANNLAVKKCQGRYILFLNSDTVIPKSTLSEMLKFMGENLDVGVSTCLLELKNGKIDPDCHRGFPTPWASLTYFLGLERLFPKSKFFGQYHAFYKPMGKIHEIDACAGAFMMARTVALDQVGLWDEDFFFYGEDLDLCYRLKKKGWKVVYYPYVKILHYKGASSGIKKSSSKVTKASRETKLKVKKASTEAMKLFYQKHYRKKCPFIIDVLVLGSIFILAKLRIFSTYVVNLRRGD